MCSGYVAVCVRGHGNCLVMVVCDIYDRIAAYLCLYAVEEDWSERS